MSKEFNHKEELKRMFESIGGVDDCSGLECDSCPFSRQNFKGNHDRCELQYAEEMIEIVRKWSEEHQERQIDWCKVPKGVDVIVGDDGCISLQRKFYCYDETLEYPYITYFNIISDTLMCFKKCELADGVEPKEEWYKD